MAAITPDSMVGSRTESSETFGDAVHLRLPFQTQTVGTLDSYTLDGTDVVISAAAWEPNGVTDRVSVTASATNAVILSADSAGAQGYLHIWINQ